MNHSTIDHYARQSIFYGLDPRAKIIGFLTFIVCLSMMESLYLLSLSFLIILLLAAVSKIPAKHLLTRCAVSLPFILFASVSLYFASGFLHSIAMFIRILASVLALIVLSATTDFFDLLKALQMMKMPRIFLELLMFMYRFVFLLRDEMHRMSQARKARGFLGGKHLFDIQAFKTISFTIGSLLVRSSERGDRILDGMLARGFDGRFRTLGPMRLGPTAIFFVILLSFTSIILLLADWGLIL